MAYNKSSSLLFILAALLLLFIGNAPLGHGRQLLGGDIRINSTQIIINGKLFCTPNGNFEVGASGAGGVAVSATLSLNATSVLTADSITGLDGQINLSFVVDINDVVRLPGLPVPVTAKLPVNGTNCTAFPPTGRLVTIPSLPRLNVSSVDVVVVVEVEAQRFKWFPF